MYSKFTERARKVMILANQEAQRFNHEYVGTEHILLGLVKEGAGVAANVLKFLGLDLRKIRLEIEKLVQAGPDMIIMGKLPQTPRTKKVIQHALEESNRLGHNHIGTEHLLLGLLKEQEGVAAHILMNLGLEFGKVREEILVLLGKNTEESEAVEYDMGGTVERAMPVEGRDTKLRKLLAQQLEVEKQLLTKQLEITTTMLELLKN